jgi:hypothetical protein
MKKKNFCTVKETIARIGRKALPAIHQIKDEHPECIYKELQKLNARRTSNPIYKCVNQLNR